MEQMYMSSKVGRILLLQVLFMILNLVVHGMDVAGVVLLTAIVIAIVIQTKTPQKRGSASQSPIF